MSDAVYIALSVERLPPTQQAIILHLFAQHDFQARTIDWLDLSERCGVHIDTARVHVRELVRAGLMVKTEGRAKAPTYALKLPVAEGSEMMFIIYKEDQS